MNDIELYFGTEVLSFELENYNQLFINDYKTFFKIMIKLKEYEGIKFDDYTNDKYKGNIILFGQKKTKKNLLVIDLNDFSKIIENLTYTKTSLLRKIYIDTLNREIDEQKVEDLMFELESILKVTENIEFGYKEPTIEKVLDFFFSLHAKEDNDLLNEPGKLPQIIRSYLDLFEDINAVIIIDSSINIMDYNEFLKDERVTLIDSCLDINENSENILYITNENVENVSLENLINRIELNWPIPITKDSINALLTTYLKIILNDQLYLYNKPSANLLCLYIIVRKTLNLEQSLSIEKYSLEDSPLKSFILENLV